jgi:hypothetical protein
MIPTAIAKGIANDIHHCAKVMSLWPDQPAIFINSITLNYFIAWDTTCRTYCTSQKNFAGRPRAVSEDLANFLYLPTIHSANIGWIYCVNSVVGPVRLNRRTILFGEAMPASLFDSPTQKRIDCPRRCRLRPIQKYNSSQDPLEEYMHLL